MPQISLPIEKIVSAYLAGTTGPALAKLYKTSDQTIYKLLRDAGVKIRNKGGRDKVYDQGWTQAFTDAYQAGETIMSIAERMGVGQGTVWRAIQQQGIKPRPHGLRQLTVKIPTDPAKLAYFAGLLDGEGNLQLRPRKQGNSKLGGKLAIYNTHVGVMEWLVSNFGGHLRWDKTYYEERGWLPKGIWEVYRARDVQALLQAVLPYLIIKRDKAEAMLAVFEQVFGLSQDDIPSQATLPIDQM